LSAEEIYKGYKEINITENELARIYENADKNLYDLHINEYLIVRLAGEVKDKLRWNGNKLVKLKYKNINNQYVGKIKPLNHEQEIMVDLIENNNITVKSLTGIPGSGKSFLPIVIGIDKVLKGEFNKFVYCRNNVDVAHQSIGALPGTIDEKLYVWQYPLIDSFGGDRMVVDKLQNENKLEVVHLGFTQGRTWNYSFILIDESFHLSKRHIYNLCTRIGYDSVIVFAGDYYQNYSTKYQNGNSGIAFLHKQMKGNSLFGCMKTKISERSKTAQVCADLLFEGLLD